jgi:hypothetical protein
VLELTHALPHQLKLSPRIDHCTCGKLILHWRTNATGLPADVNKLLSSPGP